MCIVEVYLVFLFFQIRRKIRSGAGNITVEYLRRISEGNIRGEYEFIVMQFFSFRCLWPRILCLLIENATGLFDS